MAGRVHRIEDAGRSQHSGMAVIVRKRVSDVFPISEVVALDTWLDKTGRRHHFRGLARARQPLVRLGKNFGQYVQP